MCIEVNFVMLSNGYADVKYATSGNHLQQIVQPLFMALGINGVPVAAEPEMLNGMQT